MAVSLVPRRRPGLLAVAQLAVALWLVAFTGCLCQPSYPTYPQPVPTYPTQPQPVPSYPTLPRPLWQRRPITPCVGRRCLPP
ncbi:hypothetical protein PVAP13_1KG118100 [Panicum virgatum]|uniref:Uncharacterized protein n=1 Tax=Panicum virgatum TaxID=38727 RepID=A0A8T0XD02_PANVG|nr:hypothetical protein PVAP13_1KG118100 [Panicum virgatum]